MKVFVTGASGFIGAAVVPELLGAGHQVLGLARSDASATALALAGAEVHRGDLNDLESLRAGAASSDGVIHLGYNHDFSQMAAAAQSDRNAIETFGATLQGSGHPLVIASGVLGLATGRTATEQDRPDPSAHPRGASAEALLAFADQGVRPSVVRLAHTVHGAGDHAFIATLIDIARRKGVSGYVDDGHNRWPAVHRLDVARLFRLAVEQAPAGTVLHGVAEEGVPLFEVASVIGRHLNLPVVSVPREQAREHFGWLGLFIGADSPTSSRATRELLGWQPVHPGLIADLEQGHYFTAS